MSFFAGGAHFFAHNKIEHKVSKKQKKKTDETTMTSNDNKLADTIPYDFSELDLDSQLEVTGNR